MPSCKEEFLDIVEEILRHLYVDGTILGAHTVQEAEVLRDTAVKIFGRAQFTLHKGHSNVGQLEQLTSEDESKIPYAKVQLGVKGDEAKILGLTWNKSVDTFMVTWVPPSKDVTNRQVLHVLASTFDPIGITSPLILNVKLIYRTICEKKIPWDTELPDVFTKPMAKI